MAEISLLQIFERDGITNVEFIENNILDDICIRRIGDELSQVIERKSKPHIVLNFQNVTAFSSSALGMLITLNTKVGDKNGRLALVCIKETIREVFRITKLEKSFNIQDTVEGAITSFG